MDVHGVAGPESGLIMNYCKQLGTFRLHNKRKFLDHLSIKFSSTSRLLRLQYHGEISLLSTMHVRWRLFLHLFKHHTMEICEEMTV